MKPKLAAFPKCFMDQLVIEKSMTLEHWIDLAATLGVDGLEFYSGFVTDTPEALASAVLVVTVGLRWENEAALRAVLGG